MAGRLVHEGHTCGEKPRAPYGSIWQCDCGRYWVRKNAGWEQISALAVSLVKLNEKLLEQRSENRQ